MHTLSSLLALCSVVVVVGVGCAAPAEEETGETEGASTAASTKTVVWPADRRKLVVENSGGGLPSMTPPPEGSTCARGPEKYSLDLATRNLTWTECGADHDGAPLHTMSGSRVLTTSELATIDTAMRSVALSKAQGCSEDMPNLSLAVTSTSQGTKSFIDDQAACSPLEVGSTYAENITGVVRVFEALEH